MERRELVSTGMYTQKQAELNMEQCAEFMARMIQKYGAENSGRTAIRKDTGF